MELRGPLRAQLDRDVDEREGTPKEDADVGTPKEEASDITLGEELRLLWAVCARTRDVDVFLATGESAGVTLLVRCRDAKVELKRDEPDTERCEDTLDIRLDGRLGREEPETTRRPPGCFGGSAVGERNFDPAVCDVPRLPYPFVFPPPRDTVLLSVDVLECDRLVAGPVELCTELATLAGRERLPPTRSLAISSSSLHVCSTRSFSEIARGSLDTKRNWRDISSTSERVALSLVSI